MDVSYNKDTFLARMRDLPAEFDLTDSEEQKLRNDTNKVLNALSPIIDELYLYKPTSQK